MDPKKLPDWRLHVAAEVSSVNWRGFGPRPKVGDTMILMGRTRSSIEGHLLLPIVSPSRLSLHAAVKNVAVALTQWRGLVFKAPKDDPSGPKQLDAEHWPRLFDFFEAAMGAAVSSFQSLESYGNQVIEEKLSPDGSYDLTRGGTMSAVAWPELQRRASTEEKLAEILPTLLGIPSPKGRKPWQQFIALKRVRDSSIHLKSSDLRVPGGSLDRESLFYQLLNHKPQEFVQTALVLMKHFHANNTPTWLTHAEAQLEEAARQ